MSLTRHDVYEKAALKHVCPTCAAPLHKWCTHGAWTIRKPPAPHLHQPRILLGRTAPKAGVR